MAEHHFSLFEFMLPLVTSSSALYSLIDCGHGAAHGHMFKCWCSCNSSKGIAIIIVSGFMIHLIVYISYLFLSCLLWLMYLVTPGVILYLITTWSFMHQWIIYMINVNNGNALAWCALYAICMLVSVSCHFMLHVINDDSCHYVFVVSLFPCRYLCS